ncbi:MAG TPA: sulfotransferase [Actinomycetota bacterium]|nr:sulfotransferase [Actinomycetota bacterium]
MDNTKASSSPPIFIVGCQRSGTTLLRLMLDSHPNISCGPETRFLEGLSKLAGEASARLARYGFPEDYWDRKVAEFVDSFQRDYAARRGRKRWADKTPRYALSLDYINRLFPDCLVVHVIRDGRDVVASHLARWGYWSGLKAIQKWPQYVRTARRTGNSLPAGRYREVRYEDLVAETERTMRDLLEFVGEPWDPQVLDYQSMPHDVGDLYQPLSEKRREAEGEDPVYKSRVGAHKDELDALMRLLFRLRSGRLLRELGYD